MSRPAWLAVAVGVVLGLMGGLYYAWVVNPVAYTETAPASLRADFRLDYLTLIAAAYAGDGDLPRARARLALIPDPNPAETLAALAQQRLAAGRPVSEAQALALLASALGERPTPFAGSETPAPAVTAFPTRTATSSPTAPPTRTATATPGAPYVLSTSEPVCDASLTPPRLMVEVRDRSGRAIPGVEILVLWDEGQSRFFTGLKPELGMGYADFSMTPGVAYTLQVSHSEQPIAGLTAGNCEGPDGSSYPGSWRLAFVQP